jgi:hypothetical protein
MIASGGPNFCCAFLGPFWRDLAMSLSDGQTALVIGHCGELESALVACLPHGDHAVWARHFGGCEGGRLTFGGSPALLS